MKKKKSSCKILVPQNPQGIQVKLFVIVSNLPPSFAFEELGLTFVSENMIGMCVCWGLGWVELGPRMGCLRKQTQGIKGSEGERGRQLLSPRVGCR